MSASLCIFGVLIKIHNYNNFIFIRLFSERAGCFFFKSKFALNYYETSHSFIPFISHIVMSILAFISLFLKTTDLQMSLNQIQNLWVLRAHGQDEFVGVL